MTHDLQAHVKATIRGVLREMGLLGRPPRKTGPRVLFLLHGGNPRQDLAMEQIRLMEQVAGKTSLLLTDASQFCECETDLKEASGARCLLSGLPPESFDKVLSLSDWLVIPAMPLTTAAGAAGLNGPANCRLIKAMLAGKKILVADDAFRHPGVTYAPALEQRIAGIMETLRSYGLVTAPHGQDGRGIRPGGRRIGRAAGRPGRAGQGRGQTGGPGPGLRIGRAECATRSPPARPACG